MAAVDSGDICSGVERSEDNSLKEAFHAALGCLVRTLDLYGPEGVALSFNGGKDSTVILHVLRAAVQAYFSKGQPGSRPQGLGGVRSFFFERTNDFAEIRSFVKATDEQYGLQVEYLTGDFKSGLEAFLQRSKVHAIVLGTRRGDPNADGQDMFCPSNKDYPPFMRVNPILSWSYSDVWAFLRLSSVTYCNLYDHGFTSVGSSDNTFPNSALRKEDGTFAPAHLLADSRMERAGRASQDTDGRPMRVSDAASLTRSAAIIMVGDEILSGRVEDTNTRFLCQQLHSIGWQVAKVVVVPDVVAAISAEVHAASEAYEIVITSGGLGPTRDDVTMAAVAKALNYPLTRNHALESRLRLQFGSQITAAHLKMAETPAGEVDAIEYTGADGKLSPFPLIRCRNIYVLPGIPALLRAKWQVVRQCLLENGELQPFRCLVLRLALADETSIAPALDSVTSRFSGQVTLGSYPVSEEADGARILLSLEGKDMEQLGVAAGHLRRMLPSGCVVAEEQDPVGLNHKLRQSPSLKHRAAAEADADGHFSPRK